MDRPGKGKRMLLRTRSILVLAVLIFAAAPVLAQQPPSTATTDAIAGYEWASQSRFIGVPTDWSSRHLIFSTPQRGSASEQQIQQDPRYWLQQIRRGQAESEDSIAGDLQPSDFLERPEPKTNKATKKAKIKKDWSVSLGGTGATVGAGSYPAKFSFGTSSGSCSDFVVFNTSLAGSGSQASIIAFTNLYVGGGCGSTNPTTAWAYNTGGTVSTSVVLSLDGKQMAFIHSSASGASLEVLRPVSGQGTSATSPVAPGTTSTTGNAYVTCKKGTGSCLLSLAFGNGANDTNSSPFYVYSGTFADAIFVGDDTGYVHKFTGVFNGTPAEVTTGGFPAEAATAELSSPIFNGSSGTVFVAASYDGAGNGGRLHEVDASTGSSLSTGNSGILGPWTSGEGGCNSPGSSGDATALTVDAPIVDSGAGTDGMVYVFLSNNGAGNSAIYQFAPGYAEGDCGSMVTVGTGSTTGVPVYAGTFDGIYFNSGNPASPSGNLYVCGNSGGNATLYRAAISGNAFSGTPSAVSTTLSSAATTCSPVTEFKNGTIDRAFVSVEASGNNNTNIGCPVGAGGGCIMSFTITAGTTPTKTSAAAAESGGTSGIVIDNSAGSGGSQVYFSTRTGRNAVQASQSGL